MFMVVKVGNEKFRIPIEIPDDYDPNFVEEYEEDGWEYNQSVLGFDS